MHWQYWIHYNINCTRIKRDVDRVQRGKHTDKHVAVAFTSCRLDYCNSLLYGLRAGHSVAQDAVCAERHYMIICGHMTSGCQHYYLLSACQVQSGMFDSPVTVWTAGASLLGWWLLPRVRQHHVLFAVGQPMFRLAWCHVHSAVMAKELIQPLVLVYGTHFLSSWVIRASPIDCSDNGFFGMHEHGAHLPPWLSGLTLSELQCSEPG